MTTVEFHLIEEDEAVLTGFQGDLGREAIIMLYQTTPVTPIDQGPELPHEVDLFQVAK